MPRCQICKSVSNLNACTGCRAVHYCGREHQKEDWVCKKVKQANEDGVFKEVLTEGSGDFPKKGQKITVHYTGTLVNGTKFDSSRDRNEPFSFNLGGGVIKGWNEAFAGMKVGEHAIIYIKSDWAYGDYGQGSIPPKSPLIFDVELISIQ